MKKNKTINIQKLFSKILSDKEIKGTSEIVRLPYNTDRDSLLDITIKQIKDTNFGVKIHPLTSRFGEEVGTVIEQLNNEDGRLRKQFDEWLEKKKENEREHELNSIRNNIKTLLKESE